jgi:hypothetical protein
MDKRENSKPFTCPSRLVEKSLFNRAMKNSYTIYQVLYLNQTIQPIPNRTPWRHCKSPPKRRNNNETESMREKSRWEVTVENLNALYRGQGTLPHRSGCQQSYKIYRQANPSLNPRSLCFHLCSPSLPRLFLGTSPSPPSSVRKWAGLESSPSPLPAYNVIMGPSAETNRKGWFFFDLEPGSFPVFCITFVIQNPKSRKLSEAHRHTQKFIYSLFRAMQKHSIFNLPYTKWPPYYLTEVMSCV